MVKITNKFGDVKTGKQHTVVYQGHYGNQTRRMLKENKNEHTRGQLEQRERFKTGIDFAKNLTKAQRDFIKSYMAEAGIRSPDGLPTTWYSFTKKIAMTVPTVEMEVEEGSEFDAPYGSWSYRKPITLNNQTGGTLSDHQTLITLTTENFSYAKCKADGSDLRFSRLDKTTPLPYYIKDWNYNGTSKIRVNVDSIPTGENVCIYLYYGNSQASNESSSNNTFPFFDDFEDENYNGWTLQESEAGDTVSAATKKLILTKGGIDGNLQLSRNTDIQYTSKMFWEACVSYEPTKAHGLMLNGDNANLTAGAIYLFFDSSGIRYYDTGWHTICSMLSDTEYKLLIVPDVSTDKFDIYVYKDDVEVSYSGPHTNLNFRQEVSYLNQWRTYLWNKNVEKGTYDNFLVREYASPEPSVSSFGEEDTGGESTKLKAFTIHHPAIKSYELSDAGMKEEGISNLEDHISTVVTRSNLNLTASKIVVKTLANQEYEFIVK